MFESRQNIEKLNLDPIIVKVMDKEEGYGWSLELARQVSTEYKRYLTLCLENPQFPMVPSTLVDKFWHYHILDTQKYAMDCDLIFGYFLHHFPYFGMRGEDDAKNLEKTWAESRALYVKRFGQIDDMLWPASARCPNCGRRSENECFMEERPQLLRLAA